MTIVLFQLVVPSLIVSACVHKWTHVVCHGMSWGIYQKSILDLEGLQLGVTAVSSTATTPATTASTPESKIS